MGRAEKRASFRQARANLPEDFRRNLKKSAGRRRGYIDRVLHPEDAPAQAPQPQVAPPPSALSETASMTAEEMDAKEAEILRSIPTEIRDDPETLKMITRLRASWVTPVPAEIAEKWWREWREFLDSRPEARKIAAMRAGLYVPGASDDGALSSLILPEGT